MQNLELINISADVSKYNVMCHNEGNDTMISGQFSKKT